VAPASFHDFFTGSATVAGALIGLLFVAISVSPGKVAGDDASPLHQVLAGTAFSALVDALVIALVALLPGASLSGAVIALAAAGFSSTVGLIIFVAVQHKEKVRLHQVVLLAAPLILYGLQVLNGVALQRHPRNLGDVTSLGGLSIGLFVFAIARAWELVGARDSSISASLIRLAGQIPSHLGGDAHRDAETGPEGETSPEAETRPEGETSPDERPAPGPEPGPPKPAQPPAAGGRP
jgi:hypothetical protein